MAKKQKQTKEAPQGVGFEVCNIPVSEIHPSDENPRSDIDEESVKELAESVRVYGILQPVTIRPDEDYGTEASPWVMVSGHRRLLACKMLGLETIPAIIRDDISDDKAYDIMIVENLQRKDLTPLDEAVAFKSLVDAYPTTGYQGTTIKELAARFGKSEKYIKDRLSLNNLVPELRECLKAGSLTIGAAISLSALSMQQQLAFHEEYSPVTSESDSEKVISPMSIGDVKDYIENTSDRILDQSFAEDPDEKWNNGQYHKCAGCPFNSESQGALFADMVDPGNCSNESCLNDKILAYARHIFNFWLPNFKRADGFLEPGDMVLLVEKDPWFRGPAKDEMRNLFDSLSSEAKDLGSYNRRGSRIWNTDADSRKNAIRVLNLRELVAGNKDYISYWELPQQNTDPTAPKEVTHSTIYSKLLTAKGRRDDTIYKALQPIGAAAIESYFSTVTMFQDMPYFLQLFVACRLVDNMPYGDRVAQFGSDGGYGVDGAAIYLQKHTITDILKITLTNYAVENASSSGKRLLVKIIEALADDTTKATIEEIRNDFQPKIDALVQQLHDMGYDENDCPLQADESDDSESNENVETES